MDKLSVLGAIEEGICLCWRTFGAARGLSVHTSDIEWVLSDDREGPERIFRVRLQEEAVEKRVDEIVEAMKAGLLPSSMLLTPLSTPAGIVGMLERKGLSLNDACPCMALELYLFKPEHTACSISVGPVCDAESLRLWSGVVNLGLFGGDGFSLEQYEDMFRLENTRLYLARMDGTPASACMTVRGNGVATMEFVATLPEFRRKGLGSAVVSNALADLKSSGTAIATLRSEPDGINLYKKLGFMEYCRRIVASVGA